MKLLTRLSVLLAAVLLLTAASAVRDSIQPLAPEDESGFNYTQLTEPPTTEDFSSVLAEMEALLDAEQNLKEETTEVETTTAAQKPYTTAAQTKPVEKQTTTAKRIVRDGGSASADRYRITCYTPNSDGGVWGYATSTGVRSKHLATCAVDPSVIPLGSTVIVYGNNGEVLELLACDVGSGVKGKHIDVFFDGDEADCRAWLDAFGEMQAAEII